MHAVAVSAVATWALAALVGSLVAPRPPSSAAIGTSEVSGHYAWPVRGRVLRGFEPAATPYGPGHRGIDIEAEAGTPVRAAERGVVAFAGPIAGERFVSILHPDGIRTTYSWLSRVDVRRGEAIERGAVIGRTGAGHPGSDAAHLHLGARVDDVYIDPLSVLQPVSLVGLVHLAPLDGAWARSPP